LFTATRPGPVLESLSARIGPVPHLLLPDTADGTTEPPLVNPSSPEIPPLEDRPVRVQLLGEIARGGMGVVLKGRDPDLGRDLAVKVLLEAHKEKPDLVRRFLEEAQIGGQLQHPGVVPVYELGAFGDRRPYFTMKLVKGQTLADLLAERESPTEDRPRFLSIFEQMCQTTAYAHARDVIHRDLKPTNVMVGSFGEVQVMDWGLAKVQPKGGVVADAAAGKIPAHETVIVTARSGEGSDLSQAGSVMGTPAYMAPEQARGEIDRIDERADVFALGSILCEILTGQPAFVGRSAGEIHRKAALGDLAEAMAALESSGADGELIALARVCLAREAEDRPRHAGAVAERITAYRADVQERLRTAEIARAAEQARAEEAQHTAEAAEAKAKAERQARRLTGALAASVLVLVVAFGGGSAWLQRQRAERQSRVDLVLREAEVFHDEAKRAGDDLARWGKAREAARAVERLLADARDEPTRERVTALVESVTAAAQAAAGDRKLLDKLIDIRSAKADDRDGWATDAAYAVAFREAEVDLTTLPPTEAGAKLKARPAAVAVALATALDDWAALRRDQRRDRAGAERLAQAARTIDPDPWRAGLRDALDSPDKPKRLDALRALAGSAQFDKLPAMSLNLLGSALLDAGDAKLAESVLRRAQRRYPGDVWLNYNFARCLEKLARREEAIRYYTAARSIRPEVAHELAHALVGKGESDEAIAVFQELARLRPGNGRHLLCLGRTLQDRGRAQEATAALDDAIAALREHILQRPDDAWAHGNLGLALLQQGKLDEAIAEHKEAIRIKPDLASSHHSLGVIFCDYTHDYGAAIAAFREAIRLQPDDANAHNSLGVALSNQGKWEEAIVEDREAIRIKPDLAWAHSNLGWHLQNVGKLDEAIAECREAIRLNPADADAHHNLGIALSNQGKWEEAIVEDREAIRIKPDLAWAHSNLGHYLQNVGKLDEAIAECREAIRLQPDHAMAHNNLGSILLKQGKLDEAIAECREAIRLRPDHAMAHSNLGFALLQQGKLDEAIAAFREAFRLKPDDAGWHNSLAWKLVVSPKRARRHYDEALIHARKAHELAPKDGQIVNTLALAEYRSGHWAESMAASERSMTLRNGGAASDWFFLAMAHWQQGEKGPARKWFDKAVAWTKEKDPKNTELRGFWKEAAELLGRPGPEPPGTGSPAAPAVEKLH
jgi:serine/threonine-protein kinase